MHKTEKCQIKLTSPTIKSRLCNYSDTCIFVKEIITVAGAVADILNKQVTLEHCTAFTSCVSEINNTLVDNAKDLNVMMSVYILP